MKTSTPSTPQFDWQTQPEAAAIIDELMQSVLSRCSDLEAFSRQLLRETGTRLGDWVGTIGIVPGTDEIGKAWAQRLGSVGFECMADWCHRHPAGLFPKVCIHHDDVDKDYIQIKVDSVVDFLCAQELREGREIYGRPFDGWRCATAFECDSVRVEVAENHGYRPGKKSKCKIRHILEAREKFQLRQRQFDHSTDAYQHTCKLVKDWSKHMFVDRVADLFFAAEREYWMRRNHAARVQYARQQKLGLGWANHDHHTYRSSRECFKDLIALFELMGFECRERFYAGREAGWGAQVLEQPHAGVIIFADVDLSPDEVTGDFAHEPLPPREELGTVGLWCKLHGESIFEAGMHHLECQFDFDAARKQLAEDSNVQSMDPFTDFDYLKQSFTQGEVWPVEPKRIEALLAAEQISQEQAQRFRAEGAIGSHLEILERNDGYKGFNQTGINEIIKKTDPRNQ